MMRSIFAGVLFFMSVWGCAFSQSMQEGTPYALNKNSLNTIFDMDLEEGLELRLVVNRFDHASLLVVTGYLAYEDSEHEKITCILNGQWRYTGEYWSDCIGGNSVKINLNGSSELNNETVSTLVLATITFVKASGDEIKTIKLPLAWNKLNP